MNTNQTKFLQSQALEFQAWDLSQIIHELVMNSLDSLNFDKDNFFRLRRISDSARLRWIRRSDKHSKLFCGFNPDGFAPSSALSSGVLGQGATI